MTTPPRSEGVGGFVYVLVNPAWAGRCKIGRTNNPDKRLSSYQTASPFRDFEMVATAWFADPGTAERTMLSRLQTEGEWAAIDSHFAVKLLQQLKEDADERDRDV